MTILVLIILFAAIVTYYYMKRQLFIKEMVQIDQKLRDFETRSGIGEERLSKMKEPVRRLMDHLPQDPDDGVDLKASGRLRLRPGQTSWLEVEEELTIAPFEGFITKMRTGPFPMILSGADYLYEEDGGRDLALFDLFPLYKRFDRDIERSHVGELAVLSALFCPAFLRTDGIKWEINHEHELVASFEMLGEVITLNIELDDEGWISAVWLNRWGKDKASADYGWIPYGGRVLERGEIGGRDMVTAARLSWHYRAEEETPVAEVHLKQATYF